MRVPASFLATIDYIEENLLERPLSLHDVAGRAGFSPHYFSRLFRVLTGEPLGAYVRGRRLTLAADALAAGDPVELIELAFRCQYDSQEAFTRAFKRQFGITPGQCRRSPPPFRMSWRRRLDADTVTHLQEVIDMEAQVRQIGPIHIAGLRDVFDAATKHEIPELWHRFVPRIDEIDGVVDGTTFGVNLCEDLDGDRFAYVAGVELDAPGHSLADDLVALTIPSARYAIFRQLVGEGSLHEKIQRSLRWILGTWLPDSPYEMARTPDFERYPADFDPADPKSSLEIYIPLEP